jgi:hypothetical protein
MRYVIRHIGERVEEGKEGRKERERGEFREWRRGEENLFMFVDSSQHYFRARNVYCGKWENDFFQQV